MNREPVDGRIREVGVVKAGGERNVAAILFTYRCTIPCRHCLFGCRGARPDVVMPAEKCVRYLGDLHALGRVVHIAGGEAMLYWDELSRALRLAARAGVQPHFIESNCSFASDERIVRERMAFLKEHGVSGILLSADAYHQEHVDPERFIRARAISREVFGPQNVWTTNASDDEIRDLARIVRDEARLAGYVRAHPPMLVGSALAELARFLPDYPVEEVPLRTGWHNQYETRGCAPEFDAKQVWEIHIDPYDNIQTNCGVILGNASRTSVSSLMAGDLSEANFAARILSRDGPFGLAEFARGKHGFSIPARVRSKCELCFLARKCMRQFHPEVFGPAEIYD